MLYWHPPILFLPKTRKGGSYRVSFTAIYSSSSNRFLGRIIKAELDSFVNGFFIRIGCRLYVGDVRSKRETLQVSYFRAKNAFFGCFGICRNITTRFRVTTIVANSDDLSKNKNRIFAKTILGALPIVIY